MKSHLISVALLATPLLFRGAKAQVIAPDSLRSGVHVLRALSGKPLPADVLFPPKGAPSTMIYPSYRVWVTAGSLTLAVRTMRFSFWYEQKRDSLSGESKRASREGAFEQHGTSLVFHVTTEHGGRNTLFGTVGPSGIQVVDGLFKLDFDRSGP